MKKFKFLLILLSAMIVGFSFASCSEDDDDEDNVTSELADTFWIEVNPKEWNDVEYVYFSSSKVIVFYGESINGDDYSKSDLAKCIDSEGSKYTYDSQKKIATWSRISNVAYDEIEYQDFEFQITSNGLNGCLKCTYWSTGYNVKQEWTSIMGKQ